MSLSLTFALCLLEHPSLSLIPDRSQHMGFILVSHTLTAILKSGLLIISSFRGDNGWARILRGRNYLGIEDECSFVVPASEASSSHIVPVASAAMPPESLATPTAAAASALRTAVYTSLVDFNHRSSGGRRR